MELIGLAIISFWKRGRDLYVCRYIFGVNGGVGEDYWRNPSIIVKENH